MPLAGRPMVEWSIGALRASGAVSSIVIAAPPGHLDELGGAELAVVEGGETRAESVANALAEVGTELVVVHDAARPLLTPELIEALLGLLRDDPEAAGAIAATPVTDTIKRAQPGGLVVSSTLDRGCLWAAQTPQAFRVAALREALAAGPDRLAAATDEAVLVEAAGGRVLILPSPPENLKVTAPLDLRVAELLLSERGGAHC